jgi:hypothetical protein
MSMDLLRCMSPVMALNVVSLQRTNSEAIGGTADMDGKAVPAAPDANDPTRT